MTASVSSGAAPSRSKSSLSCQPGSYQPVQTHPITE